MRTLLPGRVCAYIVAALACDETPEQVSAAVKDKFGLQLSRQRVEAWNPERVAGARLKPEWRALFHDTRRRYLQELDNIPLAHRAYRLRVLEKNLVRAEEAQNYRLVCRVLELAAKEAGNL